MALVQNDYGSINGISAGRLTDTPQRRQVYLATHKGDGTRLPFMTRSFISFTYGGKFIEDFNLIATITNDRLQKAGYATFNDTVTTYDNLDGQFYWATHYKQNTLSFILATDGMEQNLLDDFLFWFRAGEIKELILSEHPNRGIMARVAQPPELQLLPFEMNTTIMISGNEYPTKTTLYKGEISLDFVMDEPHWYGITNVLGTPVFDEETQKMVYKDVWTDADGNTVDIFSSQDAMKIIQEDGIPLGSMIKNNMLLGNGSYANVETDVNGRIWKWPEGHENEWYAGEPLGEGARIAGTIEVADYIATNAFAMITEDLHILTTEDEIDLQYDKEYDHKNDENNYMYGTYVGRIAGAEVDVDGSGIIALTKDEVGHFYYAGTAPAPTRLTFTINPPAFTTNNKYITVPKNAYTDPDEPYNCITIESKTSQTVKFTTPNLFTSYNRAVKLFNDRIGTSVGWEEIFNEVRDTIRHAGVRAWAVYVLTGLKNWGGNKQPQEISLVTALNALAWMLEDDVKKIFPATFTFDSKTGEAIGQFKYRVPTESLTYSAVYNVHQEKGNMQVWLNNLRNSPDETILANLKDVCGEDLYYEYISELGLPAGATQSDIVNAFYNEIIRRKNENEPMMPFLSLDYNTTGTSEIVEVTEDVGDMLYSNYLIIKDRNYPNEYGSIMSWEDTPKGRAYSHKIIHDVDVPLRNVQILFTNMYL